MGLIKTQGIKNSLVSYFGAGLGYLNFLILIPYAFLPSQIGLTRILQNGAFLLVPLAQLGIVSITIRYYPFFKNILSERYSFILFNLGVPLLGFWAISGLLLLFKSPILSLFLEGTVLMNRYYYYLVPLLFFLVFYGVFEALANSNFVTVVPRFIREVLLRGFITITILLFIFDVIDFHLFISFFVSAYGLSLLVLILYLHFAVKLNLHPAKFKKYVNLTFLSPSLLKEISTYGLFVILGSSGSVLVSYIDTLMVGSLLGLDNAGIYATAFFMAVIIDIPRRAISQIANPLIADAWKKDDMKQIRDIY